MTCPLWSSLMSCLDGRAKRASCTPEKSRKNTKFNSLPKTSSSKKTHRDSYRKPILHTTVIHKSSTWWAMLPKNHHSQASKNTMNPFNPAFVCFLPSWSPPASHTHLHLRPGFASESRQGFEWLESKNSQLHRVIIDAFVVVKGLAKRSQNVDTPTNATKIMGSFGAVKSSSQGWKSWVLQVSPDSTLLGSLPTFSARHSQKHPKEICFKRWELQVKVSRSVCFRNLSRSLVNLDLAKEKSSSPAKLKRSVAEQIHSPKQLQHRISHIK